MLRTRRSARARGAEAQVLDTVLARISGAATRPERAHRRPNVSPPVEPVSALAGIVVVIAAWSAVGWRLGTVAGALIGASAALVGAVLLLLLLHR